MKPHSTIILYLLPLLLFLLPQTTYQIGFVQPLTPFGSTFVNTKLPSIYNLHFSLSSGLRNDAYIRVKFANYTTLGTPTCLFDINPPITSLKATTAKACTVVGDSVYIKPGVTIASTDEIYWVIFLSQTIPDTPGYTNLFQVSTVSSTDPTSAVIFDVNPGFGNFLWGSYSNLGTLFLEGLDFGLPTTRNVQGAANDVQVHVRFNRAFTAKYSRILIVVDQPWKFGATNIVVAKSSLYDVAVAANQPTALYTAPTIFKFEIINDQVVQILFDETFPEGREFLMTVTNIINPIAIASGKLRFYTTDYTSNSVLEANENTVIYTSSKTITVTLGLSAGVPYGTGPVKFYKNTEQYMTISFPVGATTITAGTSIRYDFSADNTPVTGTLFISPTYTPADGTKVAYVYGSSSITLSNLGPLVAGTTVYIQTKVKFSKIQPNVQVKVSILINNVVVKYGESDILPLETNANSALLNIYGQNSESGVLDRIATSTLIRLSWYIDSRVTTTGSTVTIYSNKFITNAASPMACTNGVAPTPFSGCSLTNTGAYSVFTLTSAAGKNILPNGYYDITMTNLYLNKASNHQDAIYEFYIRIDRDGNQKTVQDLMVYAFVRPVRDQLTNLNEYHSLDVYANNLANFPSFIRVFGTSAALSTLTPTATENVVITINSFVSLANFLQVTNEGAFPCGSSLTITCVYVKGNPNALQTNPIDWDRVIITFPSTVTSTAFNLYIPQFFKDTSLQRFEFVVGKYDTVTRIYQNTYLEPQYTTTPWRATSFTVTASGLVSNEPNLYIDLRGQRAGVMIPSTAPITLSLESLAGYSPNWSNYYGASAVVITEWEFWNSQSTLAPVLAAYDPLSNSPQDATVYLRYTTTAGDIMNAVVYPVVASASPQKLFNIGQVEMPYSLDIPNYVVYMTDMYGYLTYYNTLINSGRNALISSAITDYSFKCKHMVQGYLNTYCTMTFTTNAKIDRQANIKISYTSAFITISQCSLSYVIAPSATVNPVSSSFYTCSSALQEIVISFNMANRLPVATYTLVFYGFDQGTGTSQGLTFSIWDANYGFIVEQTNYNYFLELAIPDVISIDSINYDYLNQDAISNFRFKFTLPRDIYPNEILEFDIGSDLQSNNKNTDRLSIILTNMNTNVKVQIYGALKSQILTVQFGQGVQLAAGSYEIGLLNLKTPSSHSNDKISIRLRRSTDNVFVMQSKESSFTSYPALQATASTFISVVNSRFLCVGCMGEFTFQVKLTNSYIDANSVLYLHFPSYYLPAIANQQAKLDCRFNLDPVVCDTQSDYPYRLRLTGSPMYLNPGDTFNITIYGFIVPNIVTDPASEQNLFFAVDSWFNGTFSEQSNVILPSLTNIKSGLGSMYFYNLVVSSTTVRDKVDHVLRVNTTVDIPIKSTISVTFTNDYSNLRYLDSLTCKLNVYIYGVLDTNYAGTTCLITGQTVKFVLTKAISKVYSLELTINSVPTPPKVATVDPNQFVVAAFGVNENDVIAITRETLNSIYTVNFVDATNTIEAQSNNDIVVTRGTYSSDIFIGTNGGKRIIQDVSITAVATGFTFVPAIIDFFVGDISHTFKVGCDQNVKLRTYPFNFTQTQDEALVNPYGDLFNVRVTVVDTPIVITVPTTITVPIGGSSLPIAVSLTNKPYKEVQILMDIDEEFYNGAFGVDLDYSSPSLNFTSTDGLKYISFFSTADIASFPSTFTVPLKLDGANYQSYKLSSDSITINIQSPATFGAATIQGTVGTIKKTQASFSITQANPGSEGMLLIQLSQSCAAKQSLSSVKNILRNNSFATTDITTDGCTSRFVNMVYNTPATPVTLSLTSLSPETKYNLYVYFENKGKQSNSASPYTYSFSTLPLDSTVKMTATFSTTVYLDQLNSMICFLLRLFQTRIVNVVDAGGLSCSSYIEPTNRFLSYTGYYFGNYANSFSFYLLPDPTLEIDASLSSVPLYFDATNHANAAFYTAAANEKINFLSDFKLEYYFSYSQAKTSTGNVKMPTLQSFTNDIITVDGNSTIRMTNFKMSARGSVYAIAREIAKVTVDPEDEFTTTDTTTRIPKTPTTTQIYACQDWNGDSVDACGRAIIANDDVVELQLRNLKVNTMYIVYYVVANEYPIEPIFANDIQSFTVRVINNAGILMIGWITLLGCIMTLFW